MKYLLFILFICSCAYGDQQAKWSAVSREVDSWTDALGCSIDPKIRETVIVFNAMGIETSQSCEGHLDHGYPYPWVEINTQTPEIVALKDKVRELNRRRLELEKSKGPGVERNKANEEFFAAFHLVEKKCKEKYKDVYSLLNEFYKNRTTSYDNMLVLKDDGLARLQSVGGDWQLLRSDEEKRAKLHDYQEEMRAFTEFLKGRFFKS